MKKSLLIFFSIMVLAVFFTGCSSDSVPGTIPGASEYTISGKVIDSVTGGAVQGAKVGFGPNIMTTDASGNYSVIVAANEAITGNFYVSKGLDYEFSVYSGLNLTPVADLTYSIKIEPIDISGYITHIVSGQIYLSNNTTEIESCSISINIINENGENNDFQSVPYTKGTGYSIETETFGSNCILSVRVDDGTNPVFKYYIDNLDLSDAPVSLDLTKPSSGFSTVTVTGVDGSMFYGVMEYSDSKYISQSSGSFSGTTNADVQIYNPAGKNLLWTAMTSEADVPSPGDSRSKIRFSTLAVPGTAVILPVFSLTAPTEAVLGSSISYSAGTLFFTGSADMFTIFLEPEEDGLYGYIKTTTNCVNLPVDIAAILTSDSDGYTSWDADVTPINISSSLSMDIFTKMGSSGMMPGIEYASISGASSKSTDLIP